MVRKKKVYAMTVALSGGTEGKEFAYKIVILGSLRDRTSHSVKSRLLAEIKPWAGSVSGAKTLSINTLRPGGNGRKPKAAPKAAL